MLELGREPDDPFRFPFLHSSGSIRLEDGEAVLAEGYFLANISGHRFGTWQSCTAMQKNAHAVFTDSRLIVSWPNWKSDPGLGSFLERRLTGPALERSAGAQLAPGCQLRHQWITNVSCVNPRGLLRQWCHVQVGYQDGENPHRLRLRVEAPSSGPLTCKFAQAVALRRLEQHLELEPEQEAALSEVAGGGSPEKLEWGYWFSLPTARRLGFDYPKPAAEPAAAPL